MSTSKKIPATIRQGGPGASHENANERLEIKSPRRTANVFTRARSLEVEVKGTAITPMKLGGRAEGAHPDSKAMPQHPKPKAVRCKN